MRLQKRHKCDGFPLYWQEIPFFSSTNNSWATHQFFPPSLLNQHCLSYHTSTIENLPYSIMAHSNPSSTRASPPSVKRSSKAKTSTPKSQAEGLPPVQPTEEPNYSSERIADYVANPTNPNPGYTYWSVEESVNAHTADMEIYLQNYNNTWNHATQ